MAGHQKKLSKPQLNHNSTQPNITLSWVRHENDFAHHPTTTPHHRNSMLAISQLLLTRFWWNFKCRFMGTSRTDSMVTFVQATFVQVTFAHNSTSAISQLLLTRFWSNFKCRLLGISRTDSCPRDICPGNMSWQHCPFQQYLSCNWPNFKESLKLASWENLEQIPTIKLTFV